MSTAKSHLLVVAGAPGAGKSETVRALLELDTPYVVFDIDWIAEQATELAGKSIYSDPTTWVPYGRLWFEILHTAVRNNLQPILFCPNTPADLSVQGYPNWCREVSWLLLDCDDTVRTARLEQRDGWTTNQTKEAVDDALELRALVDDTLDTHRYGPNEIASQVLAWAKAKIS